MEAARRWRDLVRARRREMERLAPRPLPAGRDGWDARARRSAGRHPLLSEAATESDPFLARVRRVTGRRTTVLDVGAGSGRFALALAARAAEVVAVDPSPAMLALLRRQVRRRHLANVACVEGRWEDVDVAPTDVAFSSYVLPLVEDAPAFVAKLDAVARRRCLLYLGAFTADTIVDPLWRHFHGRPRQPGPTWLDAVDVVQEMGIDPAVEVVEVPSQTRFATVAEAVDDYRDQLVLAPTPDVRRELRSILSSWLVRDREGRLRLPLSTLPAAIIDWRPTG